MASIGDEMERDEEIVECRTCGALLEAWEVEDYEDECSECANAED